MSHLVASDVAPRTVANAAGLAAMQNAYKSGVVFRGKASIPFIHIEPYLEAQLNEHATREPFAARQRMIENQGNADNQVIWMTSTKTIPSALIRTSCRRFRPRPSGC